ncbi:DUF3592 domain-containing protein [Streptomyces sp. NBC_01363]|uniref:DUF3592 domain-containing protein n=1 Tax=Streptomyces sp. NBC_01363 TaxID=2903840 RepID=UPI002253C727|nr:DUF3592 domain-containing protein [Streptomyces sp. NBC_01363]MCX4734334.1 DUF3592 domain-containing protein [Streptomyces sp. NBC_01363]
MQVQVRGRGVRWWITFGTITFGTLFLVVGLILAGVSASFLTDAERAPGTVVALERRNDHNGASRKKRESDRPVAYPVVEFTSADGTPRTFRSSTGSNPPSYEQGERVEVLYRSDSPEDARINGFASLWLLPLLFGGIGLVIAGIGTGIALVGRARSWTVCSMRA